MFAVNDNGLLSSSQNTVENTPPQNNNYNIVVQNDNKDLSKIIDNNFNKLYKRDKNGKLRDEKGRFVQTEEKEPVTAREKAQEQKSKNENKEKNFNINLDTESLEQALEKTGESYYKAYQEWKGVLGKIGGAFKSLSNIKLPSFNKKKKEDSSKDNDKTKSKATIKDGKDENTKSKKNNNDIKNTIAKQTNKQNVSNNVNDISKTNAINKATKYNINSSSKIKANVGNKGCVNICPKNIKDIKKEQVNNFKSYAKKEKSIITNRQTNRQINRQVSKQTKSNITKIETNKVKDTIAKQTSELKSSNEIQEVSNKLQKKETKLQKKETKEIKKNTKAIKKNSSKDGGVISSILKKVVKFLPLIAGGLSSFTSNLSDIGKGVFDKAKSLLGFGDDKSNSNTAKDIKKENTKQTIKDIKKDISKSKSTSKTSTIGKTFKSVKNIGKLVKGAGVVSAVMGAIDLADIWTDKEAKTKGKDGKLDKTTEVAGGMAGASAGAMAGATIGSVVPIVGTAIGGLIGGALGYMGGSFLGDKAGDVLFSDTKDTKKDKKDNNGLWSKTKNLFGFGEDNKEKKTKSKHNLKPIQKSSQVKTKPQAKGKQTNRSHLVDWNGKKVKVSDKQMDMLQTLQAQGKSQQVFQLMNVLEREQNNPKPIPKPPQTNKVLASDNITNNTNTSINKPQTTNQTKEAKTNIIIDNKDLLGALQEQNNLLKNFFGISKDKTNNNTISKSSVKYTPNRTYARDTL